MSATPANTLAALRQLACLGLPGKAILPEAVELLRALVGFEYEAGGLVTARYEVTDAHAPSWVPPAALLDYIENFHNRRDGDGVVGLTTREALDSGLNVIRHSDLVKRRALANTEFYDRIMRPLEMGWTCQLPLREGSRPLGFIVLARPFSSPDFSNSTIRLLERAQPWLCHALANGISATRDAEPTLATGDSAMLVLDSSGRILASSPGALVLLHQAAGESMGPEKLRAAIRGDTATLLRRLAGSTAAAIEGKRGPLPAGVIRNSHGVFRLRAYALDAFTPGMPLQVSLQIERYAPLSQRLFRSARFLALSARERDVCLAILTGCTHRDIAMQLGIKPSSVIHHTRSLYRRLEIDGQKTLLPALLGELLP